MVEIDPVSRAARIEGGVFGPALEAQLRPHGLTLRHFPQSFEYSTLGGWIATRSGGHFATLYTHIDDLVESIRMVTPQGVVETRRLPGSGAGPSPDRLLIGSEGILGVITEAWVRLQQRPRFRAGGAVRFADFFSAARAVKAIAQAGLYPANCRILDPQEAANTGAGDGSAAIMVLAFESGDHPLDAWVARALECCADHGGTPERPGERDAHREGAAEQWRTAFIRMPYARERMIRRAVIADTFETAITWERFERLHDRVKAATEAAIREATGRPGQVTCRFTHAYPDGPAPYFSFHALGRHGALEAQWRAIKSAAGDALIAAGGTITHHHAVGRDHRPVVRPAATRSVRRGVARGETCARPARAAQSGRVDRPVMVCPVAARGEARGDGRELARATATSDCGLRVPDKVVRRATYAGSVAARCRKVAVRSVVIRRFVSETVAVMSRGCGFCTDFPTNRRVALKSRLPSRRRMVKMGERWRDDHRHTRICGRR